MNAFDNFMWEVFEQLTYRNILLNRSTARDDKTHCFDIQTRDIPICHTTGRNILADIYTVIHSKYRGHTCHSSVNTDIDQLRNS